jgi:hypothetical protein
MPGNTRAPRNRAPDIEDFEPVIEQQAQAIDDTFASNSPVGSYSGRKLNAMAAEVTKVIALMDPEVSPLEPMEDVEEGPLPLELTKQYDAVIAAETDFAAAEGEQPTLPPVDRLVSDAALGSAMGRLRKLAGDRDFKRFLQEEAPEDEVMAEEVAPVEEGIDETANPEIGFL